MENLKLHASGKEDHSQALKEKYQALKYLLKENKTMSDEEKKEELKRLDDSLKVELKQQKNNLY